MVAQGSMQSAIDEVKAMPDYPTKGEVILQLHFVIFVTYYLKWTIIDAWHDSTANAYHTTVPCLSGKFVINRYVDSKSVFYISLIKY